jgi:hypothetical protein
MEARNSLNGPQELHLVTSLEYVDRLLSEIESILAAGSSRSPFQKYNTDLSPAQSKVVQDYIERIRAQMVRLLEANSIRRERPRYGAIHSIRTNLTFVQIALEEITPHYMRGYGEVPESLVPALNGMATELQGLVDKLDAYLVRGLGQDLQKRIRKLDEAGRDVGLLKTAEFTIAKYGLVEIRPALSLILDRMESDTFEIGVFGRVSSGKSSLLNYIADEIESQLGLRLPVNPVSVMKEHSWLLDRWFEDEIVPLRERHQEMARQSLHRKIGALLDSVAAALRTRLGRKERIPEDFWGKLKEAEAGLREVSGKFHEAREFYQEAASQIRELGPTALARAASDIVNLWSRNGGATTSVEGIVISAVTLAADKRARLTHAMLESLARALEQAQSALGTAGVPAQADLASVLKEMPRLDLGAVAVKVGPSLHRLLGKRLAVRWVEWTLRRRIGAGVSRTLTDYGSLFEAWAKDALEDLKERFESQADACRAQFERFGQDRQATAGDEAQIRSDLESLLGRRSVPLGQDIMSGITPHSAA